MTKGVKELGNNKHYKDILDFWNLAVNDYDEYVLGKSTPKEVRAFEEAEDSFFDQVLREHITTQKRTVFIEIGSGTGRYLVRCLSNVFTDKRYEKYLSHIIGVDVSLKMIRKSIINLDNNLERLAEIMNVSLPVAKRRVRERLLFVNADATKHYLSIGRDLLIFVGLMFGTLGNIPEECHNSVLARIRTLIDRGGESIITVFDAEKYRIGLLSYKEMKKLVGRKLEWNYTKKTFTTSDKNFYSRWFTKSEFKGLLKRNMFEILEWRKIPKRGIGVRVTTARGRKRMPSFPKDKERVSLLCPKCSAKICDLPISKWSIQCPRCFTKFLVEDISGFRIPILV